MEMNYTMASNSRWNGGVDSGDFTGDRVLSFSTTLKILRRIKASGIFASTGEDDMLESENANATPSNKIGLRMYQQVVASMSQISYGEDEAVSPKKPTSLPEMTTARAELGSSIPVDVNQRAARAEWRRWRATAGEFLPAKVDGGDLPSVRQKQSNGELHPCPSSGGARQRSSSGRSERLLFSGGDELLGSKEHRRQHGYLGGLSR
nr:uncharacterized protein LOC109170103 [Ipomoea batatas]